MAAGDLYAGFAIQRLELGMADMVVLPPDYKIVSLRMGKVTKDYITASSIDQHGDQVVSARKRNMSSTMRVRVTGADQLEMWSKLNDLVVAFDQLNYTIGLYIGATFETSQVFGWQCWSAEWETITVGPDRGAPDPFMLRASRQDIEFTFPRHPVPLVGINL